MDVQVYICNNLPEGHQALVLDLSRKIEQRAKAKHVSFNSVIAASIYATMQGQQKQGVSLAQQLDTIEDFLQALFLITIKHVATSRN